MLTFPFSNWKDALAIMKTIHFKKTFDQSWKVNIEKYDERLANL